MRLSWALTFRPTHLLAALALLVLAPAWAASVDPPALTQLVQPSGRAYSIWTFDGRGR